MTLEEKIKNRDTELHRAYDTLRLKEAELEGSISWHERELNHAERELVKVRNQIELCEQRAEEQGYPGVL